MATNTAIAATSHARVLAIYPHLTSRDRYLLALLDAHRVLTTGQVQRLMFTAERTCQVRLALLRRLGLLERFRFARDGGGSYPWHWTLGLAGARLRAAATGRPAPTQRAHGEQLLRLTIRSSLAHLVACNEFFVRLRHHTRTHQQASLDRWWSEREATARFLGIRPDGHGIWTEAGATVGFHLECDLGTEALPRLVTKLAAYHRLAYTGGPDYPVLFWLPSPRREAHLQQLLRAQPPPVPVATATHELDPAGPVWLPVDGRWRVRLAELPALHGEPTAGNPNWSHGRLDLT
ncbi:MAG: hypothetical protein GEV12_08475 [Micromonosporaceae bacterium]|nr:hypothetical protein [Micromonosporaceae bacterium]